jgi:outer membrane protein
VKNLSKVLVSVVLSLGLVSVASAKDYNIALIDGNQIMQEFQPGIDAKLKKEFKTRQDKLVGMQTELQTTGEKLNRDSSIMAETELKKQQEKFVEKQKEFQKLSVAFNEDVNKRGNEEMQKLVAQVKTAVDTLAKEGKYDLVLQKGAVMFTSSNNTDITTQVISKLKTNAKS